MDKLPDNLVVIDLETGGLDENLHPILELGAVDAAGRELNLRIRTEKMDMLAEVLDVNGIALHEVHEGLSVKRAMVRLYVWLMESHPYTWLLAGKNPNFDRGFLSKAWPESELNGLSATISRRTIDIHTLAYGWAMQERPELDLTAKDFRTDLIYQSMGLSDEPKPHHALRGARLEMLALRFLICGEVPTARQIELAMRPTRQEAQVT